MKWFLVCTLLTVAFFALACGASGRFFEEEKEYRQELITEIRELESRLGFTLTNNFLEYSDAREAYYLCFYIENLTLENLLWEEGTAEGCPGIAEVKYDIFFYPAEAVAGIGGTPLTRSLVTASLERFIVVVIHEDFHEQLGAYSNLPPSIEEPAATLVGFIAAAQFAEEKFGKTSDAYKNLKDEASLFLQTADIHNDIYTELATLYSSVSSGEITEEEALVLKEEIFEKIRTQCAHFMDKMDTTSCTRRNNADFVLGLKYTKFYPLMYEVYETQGEDLQAFMGTILELALQRPQSEQDAVDYLEAVIDGLKG